MNIITEEIFVFVCSERKQCKLKSKFNIIVSRFTLRSVLRVFRGDVGIRDIKTNKHVTARLRNYKWEAGYASSRTPCRPTKKGRCVLCQN